MVSEIDIQVMRNPDGGYVAIGNQATIMPARGTDWLTFRLVSFGWSFATGTTAPRAGLRSPPPRNLPACGIWVDDPNLNFACVRYQAKLVVLSNNNRDIATMPEHYYMAVMTNGSEQVMLDPMVRDRGP